MLVDSHVNLHSEQYDDDRDAVIAAALEAGVSTMVSISDRLESTSAVKQIADAHDFIWRSVGVHPHYAKEAQDLKPADLIGLAADPKVVGIGECGLDYHYEYSERDTQGPVFRTHVEAARETNLPLIIHSRNADEDMQSMLKEEYALGAFTPLMHCYTSGLELARTALELGGYISFSGIITFKNAEEVRAVARETPLDRVIIETDCPYLAPVPKRGRRNEPALLIHVAEKLADVKGVSLDEIAQVTTDNFYRLFSRANRNHSVQ
ncbi:MAG: TatD family hydrolase [Pseudomonadota bacterium]